MNDRVPLSDESLTPDEDDGFDEFDNDEYEELDFDGSESEREYVPDDASYHYGDDYEIVEDEEEDEEDDS